VNKKELIELATQYLIADDGLSKSNLIRKIQLAQGKQDCFATGKNHCDQTACPWRKDCMPEPIEIIDVQNPFNKKIYIAG